MLVMLSAAAVAYFYEDAQPRVYQTQVTLVAKPVPPDNGLIEAIKKTMPTYRQELGSKDLLRRVLDDNLIRDVSLDALGGQIDIQAQPDNNALVMRVDDGNPRRAAVLAEAISQAFVLRQAADQQASPGGNRVVWTITQPAEEATQPYKPRPRLYAVAAALFGLILGLLLAIGLELLDTTLKTPADVQQYTELTTLGIIPRRTK